MSQLPSTPATLPRPPKRAHEEELVGPIKRQRQHGLWTPPEDSSDVYDCYTQTPSLYIPRQASSSLVHPPYLSPPHTHPSVPLNPRGVNSGYRPSQGGLYTPTLGYIHGNNRQHGSSPPSRPPTAPQMGFGNLYQVYGPNVNRHHAPVMQRNDVWELHEPQTAHIYAPDHPMGPTLVQQPVQTTRPEYAPRLHTPQTAHGHQSSHPMVPTMPANSQLSQQQPQRIQPLVGTQGLHQYSAIPVAATQGASHQTGVEGLHRGAQVPAVNVQTARTTPRTQQEQWLIDAHPDLQGEAVTVIPAIDARQGTIGSAVDRKDEMLVPRDVWRLRSLPSYKRYIAYRQLAELGRQMSEYDQASKENQLLWKRITTFEASLMEAEVEFANRLKQDTAETRARWDRIVAAQAVGTLVDQDMVAAYDQYCGIASATSPVDVADTTQLPTSDQVLAGQNSLPQPQTSRAPAPIVIPSVPVERIRPDQVTHPLDKVPVPPYPGDLEDFTPHEVTGMYKCNHQWLTGACCIEGVTKERKRASISRDKSAWKRKVEVLVKKGDLHESHITWKQEQSPSRGKDQKMETAEKGRLRDEKKADASAKKEARKEQRKKWRDEPHNEVDAGAAPGPILAPNSLEQDVASTSDVDSELSSEEEAAAIETARQEKIAKDVKKYEWDIKRCRLYERRKKWPNWPRFNEYWEVKHLEAQGFQLSPEQRIISEGDEPSGIPDKNPAFVKKKAEETVPVAVQEPVEDSSLDRLFEDTEENVEQDDTSLDDLFEDDGSE